MEMNFDPMTGEPINKNVPRFDPMTGEPIYQNANGKGSGGKGKKIGILLAVAVLILAVAGGIGVWAFSSGLFVSPEKKVLLAAYNTINDKNQLMENLNMEVLKKDEFTATVSAYVDGVDVSASVLNGKNEKQVNANVYYYGMDINAIASLDDTYLKLQIPTLSEDVFGYNYTIENTGYLAQMMGYSEISLLNEALQTIYDLEWQGLDNELTKDLVKVLEEDIKTLEFEKTDKKSHQIDGDRVDCKGYRVVMTEEFVRTCLQDIADVLYDHYGTAIDSALAVDGYMTWDAVIHEMLYDLSGMEEVVADFYLDDNKLASVALRNYYGDEIQVLFKGGETRMQNIEILEDGFPVFSIEGTTEDSAERIRFYEYGSFLMELYYDAEDGYFYAQDSYGDFYVQGNLLTTGKQFYLSVNELYADETYFGSMSVDITSGADPVSLDGELIDIGNISESELGTYVLQYEDFFDELYY